MIGRSVFPDAQEETPPQERERGRRKRNSTPITGRRERPGWLSPIFCGGRWWGGGGGGGEGKDRGSDGR